MFDSKWKMREHVLRTNWMYMGDLVAEDSSLLTCIDSASFGDIICSSITTQKAAVMYAKDFLLQANSFKSRLKRNVFSLR